MSDGSLNQEEIDMLLRDADDVGGQVSSEPEEPISFGKPSVSQNDKDNFKHFLNEIGNRSTASLSAILAGRGIKLKIEEIEVYTKDEIIALLNDNYAVFKSDITGDFIGSLLILLEKQGSISMAGLATGYNQPSEEPLNEMTLSVIQEFLSIYTNSFTNTLKSKIKKNIAFPGIEVKEYAPEQIPFQDTDTFVKVLYLLTIDETISTNMHLIMNYDAVQSIMEFLRTETTMEAGASARPQQAPTQPPPQYQQQHTLLLTLLIYCNQALYVVYQIFL
jgi:chemotaxis protein CheY-P-specific phosphatase CheC